MNDDTTPAQDPAELNALKQELEETQNKLKEMTNITQHALADLQNFRRRAEEGLLVQAQALQSAQPLWALWRFGTDPGFTRISMEFMALANHRKEMRAEIAYYAERFREEQRQAVTAALQRYGVDSNDRP